MFADPPSSGLTRITWDGTLRDLGTLWTIEQGGRQLTCRLVSCPRGRELWLLDGDRVVRAEVCREGESVLDVAAAWRR